MAFRRDLEQDDDGDLVDLLPMKSISYQLSAEQAVQFRDEMKEFDGDHDTDHELEEEHQQRYTTGTAPSYVDPDGIDTASFVEPIPHPFGVDDAAEIKEDVTTMDALDRTRNRRNGVNGPKQSLRAKDFTFLSVIGRGTFGKILLVKKREDDTVFAMKILKKTQIIRLGQERNIKAERNVLKRFMVRNPDIFSVDLQIDSLSLCLW